MRIASIINDVRPLRPEATVRRTIMSIASQSNSTMLAAIGLNGAGRICLTTKDDCLDHNHAYIATDFSKPYKGPFNRDQMNSLFAYDYEMG